MKFELITGPNSNFKISKDTRFLGAGISLAPNNISGYNVCPSATNGCKACCIYYTGNGLYPKVPQSRIRKTKLLFENKNEFVRLLYKDMHKLLKYADGYKIAFRMNIFSDIPFYKILDKTFWKEFNCVKFYDYTKVEKTFREFMNGETPKGYHYTFSFSENNGKLCEEFLSKGFNVSKVFGLTKKQWLDNRPKNFVISTGQKFTVLDGELSDFRFLDKKGCIVGLYSKGKALKDNTGFVHKISLPIVNL